MYQPKEGYNYYMYMCVCGYIRTCTCMHVCGSTNLVRELPDFLQDGLYWSASLSASREGDDTETAHVLTPTHYGTGNKNTKFTLKYRFILNMVPHLNFVTLDIHYCIYSGKFSRTNVAQILQLA